MGRNVTGEIQMKRFWAVLIVVMSVQAHSNEQLFLFAQKEYENHNFDKALALFAKIKPANASVWYNMGSCYFHLGNDIEALVHWQRAYHYGTGSLVHASAARIAELEAKLGVIESPSLGAPVQQFMRANLQALSLLLLQILFFCAFSVFLFVASRARSFKNYFVSGGSLFLVLVLATLMSIKYTQQSARQAVVLENNTTLLVGPNCEYHTVATVNAGTQVAIVKQQDNWYKVSGETAVGWVEKKCIALV
jgi:tetratricopeptide (TPR) repeat protein